MHFKGAILAVFALAAVSPAATVSHIYELNGSFADTLGGPAMVSAGGTLGASGYTFSYDQGPNLSNAITSDYSIELLFRLDEVGGYNRVFDFKNRTTDIGVYVQDGGLKFWPITSNGPTTIAANEIAHVVLTRNGGGTVTGYLQGIQQFSFVDSGSDAVFSGPNNIIHILRDEGTQGVPGEHSAGFLDRVRIYEGALTGVEVAALQAGGPPPGLSAVPEPSTWTLIAAGMSILGVYRKRRA
jgi:hypothetical protein